MNGFDKKTKEFDSIIKFRNVIMHSESTFYHIIMSDDIEKRAKDNGTYDLEKKSIENLKSSKKMFKEIFEHEEIRNEYNFRLNELQKWFEKILNEHECEENKKIMVLNHIKNIIEYCETLL